MASSVRHDALPAHARSCRASRRRSIRRPGETGLGATGAESDRRLRLAYLAATLFAGLLVVSHALQILGQTFFFAGLLEALEHLLGGLVAAEFHFDHKNVLSS